MITMSTMSTMSTKKSIIDDQKLNPTNRVKRQKIGSCCGPVNFSPEDIARQEKEAHDLRAVTADAPPGVEKSSSDKELEYPNKPRDPNSLASLPAVGESAARVDMEPIQSQMLNDDTNKIEELTIVEVYRNLLEEAARKLKKVATDDELSQAKDVTITFLQETFVPKIDKDDPSTHEDPDKKYHNKACKELDFTFGKMLYIVRRLLPEHKALLKDAEMAKQRIERDGMPDALKADYVSAGDKKITSLQQEIKDLYVEYGKLHYEEEEWKDKLVGADRRDEEGFDKVPTLFDCKKCYELEPDPVSKDLVLVNLTDAEKEVQIEQLVLECDQYYDNNKEIIISQIEEPKRKSKKVRNSTPIIKAMENGDTVLVEHSSSGNHKWHEAKILANEGKSHYKIKYLKGSEVEIRVPVRRISLQGPGEWGDDRRHKYKRTV